LTFLINKLIPSVGPFERPVVWNARTSASQARIVRASRRHSRAVWALQELSNQGVLSRADYLSAVSGGSYWEDAEVVRRGTDPATRTVNPEAGTLVDLSRRFRRLQWLGDLRISQVLMVVVLVARPRIQAPTRILNRLRLRGR
jgi:hypothetical protein